MLLSFLSPAISQTKSDLNYQADFIKVNKAIAPGAERLIGNVRIEEQSAVMYCDSAYSYQNKNFDAYGSIRIVPKSGNTTLTGRYLHYDAAQRIANITGNVVLVDDSTTLVTQTAFYDMKTSIATYPTRGVTVSGKNRLVSDQGAYNKLRKIFYFKRNVVVTNPDMVIHTDTMNYNSNTEIVEFISATRMLIKKKDSIYCERGWYDSKKDISLFRQNAWIKSDGKVIRGDTLYYENLTGLGKGYGNVEMIDTTSKTILKGNFATFDRVKNSGLVTKRALMIKIEGKDSLYLHADTLYRGIYAENPDTLHPERFDTVNYIKAFHHVKFFRTDLAGKSDSLYYSSKDSTFQFMGSPVLWTGDSQLKADLIHLLLVNKKIDKMKLFNSAIIISREDSIRFNQIRGRTMTGYFANNQMQKMIVKGNGQILFIARDGEKLMGVNKAESSDISILFKNGKLHRFTPIGTVVGSFHPPLELSGDDIKLKDFVWYDDIRPYSWRDVFDW